MEGYSVVSSDLGRLARKSRIPGSSFQMDGAERAVDGLADEEDATSHLRSSLSVALQSSESYIVCI